MHINRNITGRNAKTKVLPCKSWPTKLMKGTTTHSTNLEGGLSSMLPVKFKTINWPWRSALKHLQVLHNRSLRAQHHQKQTLHQLLQRLQRRIIVFAKFLKLDWVRLEASWQRRLRLSCSQWVIGLVNFCKSLKDWRRNSPKDYPGQRKRKTAAVPTNRGDSKAGLRSSGQCCGHSGG